MAGDWLKIEATTPDKPEVFEIATKLNMKPEEAFGRLFLVWRFFDQHTEQGNATNVSPAYLDRISGVTGFAEVMRNVGWLVGGEGDSLGVELPNFDRHNGKTAKSRALTARRVLTHKKRSGNDKVTVLALPREEKRREEKEPPLSPLGLPAGVTKQLWQSFREARQKLRKPMTAYAEQKNVAKLGRLMAQGYDASKLIDKAIERGWASFFPNDDCLAGEEAKIRVAMP